MHPDGYRANQEDVPDMITCKALNYSWENSEVHFDHVPMAYLALFQVATWKGWIPIMNDAIDTTAVSYYTHLHHVAVIYNNVHYHLIVIMWSPSCDRDYYGREEKNYFP